jgi:LPXTG-motif cell wall-anchored protein
MKRVTRNGVIAMAAASGAIAMTMPVYADSAANGTATDSPGLISGNTIQLPAHVPVNACGNTVNVVGVLNPAAGNTCVNEDGAGHGDGAGDGGGRNGVASAEGRGKDSPGVVSGNTVQLPVHVPVNAVGNSVNVVGVGNPATGNESVNHSGARPHHPAEPAALPTKHHPKPRSVPPTAPQPVASLAHTGTDQTLPAVAGSAALVLGGAILYRRFRSTTPH